MTKTILIVFLLCTLSMVTVSETFVSSGQDTVISSGVLTLSAYAYGVTFPVSTAKWIWNQNWKNSPLNQTITFFNRFKVACACKTYTLYITADNSFKAYVNGNYVLSGNNWSNVYSIQIPSYYLNIGDNTLEVVAANSTPSPAAALYAIQA